jgi:hypothetical protein
MAVASFIVSSVGAFARYHRADEPHGGGRHGGDDGIRAVLSRAAGRGIEPYPVDLAEQLAVRDVVSGGRLDVGIGGTELARRSMRLVAEEVD